jgi:lysine decarboxylase
MGLLRGLTEFKRAYDLNLRVKNMLPDLYAEDPDFTAICVFRIWRRGSIV